MAGKDVEATNGHSPHDFTVEREDSASKGAGHMRLDLVDDKLGKSYALISHQIQMYQRGMCSCNTCMLLQIPTTKA